VIRAFTAQLLACLVTSRSKKVDLQFAVKIRKKYPRNDFCQKQLQLLELLFEG